MNNLLMVYWKSTDGSTGCVLVSVPQNDPEKIKKAMKTAMNKAIAIHSTAEFLKVEVLPNKFGVLWTGEYI